MKFNKLFFFVLLIVFLSSMGMAFSADLSDMQNHTLESIPDQNLTSDSFNSYYVDDASGDDVNDGKSWDAPFKTFNQALDAANDDDIIYLSDGVYSGLENTKITIEKSVNIIGSTNTNFDGNYENYLFLIPDDVKVTFKNIKFINAYKTELDSDLIDDYELEGIFGGALDIKDAKVTLDNCYFKYNMANYDFSSSEFAYGGAISNFGELTIINSYFDGNAIGASTDIYGYGGAIYNKGRMFINNSFFNDSRGNTYSYGGAIYNDGIMIINNTVIRNSYCWEESKGSAIFNNGNLTLLNSIIENNTIERTNFNYIYGNIFNSGKLIAIGNIFRNNAAYYKQPNSQYIGTPTIYNVGDLELFYNAFIDNVGFKGIFTDVSLNGGNIVNIDNNWWNTNTNPSEVNKINFDMANSWIILDLDPQYASIKNNDSVTIKASWKLTNGENIDINKFPVFNLTFKTIFDEINSTLNNGTVEFIFNNTENSGSYIIEAIVNSFSTQAIVDIGKINTFIKISTNSSEIYSNDSINVEIFLFDENSENLSENVMLYLNNNYYIVKINEGHGNFTFSNLMPQNYTLKVVFNGNDVFSKSSNETMFIVKKSQVILDILPIEDIKTSDNVNLTVNLTGYQKEVMAYLYINGVYKQPIYLNNGLTTFNLSYFSKGKYNITVVLPESSYYTSAFASVVFNVDISSVILNVSCQDVPAGEPAIIVIEASYENFYGNAILSINGINNTVTLNNKINRIAVSNLANGTYYVELIFEGNDRFTPANASTSFIVYKKLSSLNVTIEKNNLTGTVTVKTNSTKCTGIIGLYVNNRYYTKALYRGAATFDVEFDKGTNYIYVFYNGDFTYEGSAWNTTIGHAQDYFIIVNNITDFEYNEFNYTVGLYEENGIAMPYQTISITLENKTYNVTTNNMGIANLNLILKEGLYLINATYKNVTVSNSILIKPIKFNIISSNITYGQTECIIIDFDGNFTGKFILEFLDKTIVQEIINSKVLFNLEGLNAGNYSFNIYYSNEFFNSTKINNVFEVKKANPNVKIEITGLEVNKTGNITVTLEDNATGNISFIVDNVTYSKEIIDSKAILYIYGLSPGNHDLEVIFLGDSNYNNESIKTQFIVKNLKTDLKIQVNDNVSYGNELIVTAKVNENATGNITFKMGNVSKTCEIKEGIAIWKISYIDVGTYRITADYESDCLFINQKNETSVNILKANSTIELYTTEVYLDQNIRIYVNLSPKATGNVTFSMPGYYSPRTKSIINSTCNWYISPLKSGKYTVIAVYNGDKNYHASNTTFILNVNQRKSILNVEIADVTKNERVTANIRLTTDTDESISGKVTLTIGKRTYGITVNNGKGLLFIGKLDVGAYNYQAEYEGNDNFSKSSDEGSFNVFEDLISTQLNVGDMTKYVGGKDKLIVTLSQSDGKLISNAIIHININNKDYALTTDSDGKVSLDVNLKKGSYKVKIRFDETTRYSASSADITISVLSTIESADVVKLYGSGTQYFAIFKDCDGKALGNILVTFKIGSNSYSFRTAPNGIVRVNINLNPGVYTITVTNPATGEVAKNKIRVFAYIMGNTDVVKYFGANKNYKVRIYDDTGKVVGAGKVVKFKINGKTYSVKTDKNGYATCKLNFKPNTYTIKATYNKFTVSNRIVIKPVLIYKSISYKKSKLKFSVKLVNSKGKILKNKKIKFKFKGKIRKVKTNKKGIAKFVLKTKLKVGKHKIKSIYGKSKIIKYIVIKK